MLPPGAMGGQLRLQCQLRSCAPRGKVGHAGHRRGDDGIFCGDGQNFFLLLRQIRPVGLGDEGDRYGPGGDGHINHTRLVVIDNHTDGAGLLGSPGLCLVIGAAPLYDGDFSPDIQAQIVFLRAGTGDHDVRQRPVGRGRDSPG
mgnify:CR=1 FL=1